MSAPIDDSTSTSGRRCSSAVTAATSKIDDVIDDEHRAVLSGVELDPHHTAIAEHTGSAPWLVLSRWACDLDASAGIGAQTRQTSATRIARAGTRRRRRAHLAGRPCRRSTTSLSSVATACAAARSVPGGAVAPRRRRAGELGNGDPPERRPRTAGGRRWPARSPRRSRRTPAMRAAGHRRSRPGRAA